MHSSCRTCLEVPHPRTCWTCGQRLFLWRRWHGCLCLRLLFSSCFLRKFACKQAKLSFLSIKWETVMPPFSWRSACVTKETWPWPWWSVQKSTFNYIPFGYLQTMVLNGRRECYFLEHSNTYQSLTPLFSSPTVQLHLSYLCDVFAFSFGVKLHKWKIKGQCDSSVDKGACHQVWWSEFKPQNLCGGRKELTPASCLLCSTHTPWWVSHTHT